MKRNLRSNAPKKIKTFQWIRSLPWESNGDLIYRFSKGSEDHLQTCVVKWVDDHTDCLLFSIPNGSTKSWFQKAMFQLTGLRSGVTDLFLAEPVAPYHGFFIELKTPQKGGSMSPNQKAFAKRVSDRHYKVGCYNDLLQAIEAIKHYLKI